MLTRPKPTDEQIVHDVLSGRHEAFAVLVERYLPVVQGLAYARMGSHADAEDAAQETFLKAFESLDALREAKKFGAWLVTIAKRVCASMGRRRSRESALAEAAQPAVDAPDVGQREIHALLRTKVMELDEIHRDVLLLHYFSGKKVREIAELLGITTSTAKMRLKRAREALGTRMLHELPAAARADSDSTQQVKRIMAATGGLPVIWKTGAAGGTASATAATIQTGAFLLTTKALTALVIVVLAASSGIWLTLRNQEADQTEPDGRGNLAAAQQASEPKPSEAPEDMATTEAHNEEPSEAGAVVPSEVDVLRGPGVVEGTVWTADGLPAPGSAVKLFWAKGNRPLGDVVWESKTLTADELGRFSFKGLAVGPFRSAYVLLATRNETSACSEGGIEARFPEKEVALHLVPCDDIEGIVRNVASQPIAGARVRPLELDSESAQFIALGHYCIPFQVNSDVNGRFVLRDVQRGRWKLSVEASGYFRTTTEFIDTGSTGAELVVGRGAALSGHVVHAESGEPAAGAVVAVETGAATPIAVTRSGEDGHFCIEGIPDGLFDLRAGKGALVPAEFVDPIEVSDGAAPAEIDIRLVEGGVLIGRVYDEATGNGIPGIELECRSAQRVPAGKTDDSGRYRFEGVSGQCELWLRQPGEYANVSGRIAAFVLPGQVFDGLDMPLKRGVSIRGTVVDEDGEPVPEAVVFSGYGSLVGRSGEDGAFAISAFLHGNEAYVQVRKRGYGDAQYGPLSQNEGVVLDDIRVVLHPEASVAGRVVDAAGAPVSGAKVMARPVDRTGHAIPDIRTDLNGAFHIRRLAAGAYRIEGSPPLSLDHRSVSLTDLRLAAGEHVDGLLLKLESPPGLSISGRVTYEDGSPAARAIVQCLDASGAAMTPAMQYTRHDGTYTLAGLPEGSYTLRTGGQEKRVVAGSTDVDLVVPNPSLSVRHGAVEGRIVRSDTGEPVTEAEVELAVRQRAYSSHCVMQIRNQAGRFRIERLWGPVKLSVRAPGSPEATLRVDDVAPGKTVRDVVVRLQGGNAVVGQVVDAAGAPVADAFIFNGGIPMVNRRQASSLATSGADGRFRIDSLGEGTQVLTAYHPDYVGGFVEVDVQTGRETSTRIVVQKGGTLHGTVRFRGQPVAGQLVQYHGKTILYQDLPDPALTDAEGAYTFEDVSPGELDVTAKLRTTDEFELPSFDRSTPAIMGSGRVTEVDFDFGGAVTLEGVVAIRGVPVEGGRVSLKSLSDGGQFTSSARIGKNGHYAFDAVPVGTVSLEIYAEPTERGGRARNHTETVEVPDQPAVIHDIELATGDGAVEVLVEGVSQNDSIGIGILRGDVAITEFSLEAFKEFEPLVVGMRRLEGENAALFDGLEDGEYTVFVMVIEKQYENDRDAVEQHIRFAVSAVSVANGGRSEVMLLLP